MSKVTELASAKAATSTGASAKYVCVLAPDSEPVPDEFARLVLALEEHLKMPVWLLIQERSADSDETFLGHEVLELFDRMKTEIENGRPVCLVVESAGGLADVAYKIARLFQRRASKFVVVIPSYAKSAATLLARGAHELLLGRDAELGPLDV